MARPKRRRRIKIFSDGKYFDFSLLFIVIFLLCFGLVMIYSTSSYKGTVKFGDPAYYFKRQALFGVLGIFIMIVISKLDYHIFKHFTMIMFILAATLLVLVIAVGSETKGSSRWIELGALRFQPSEVAKIVIILGTAHIATKRVGRLKHFKDLIIAAVVPVVLVGLIAIENLSTAIISFAIVAVILFVASPGWKNFAYLAGIGIALGSLFLATAGYRMERIEIWRNIETHPKGYQTLQALYAIGSGGIFGRGLGKSIQKMGFIPESHNDMIFSVICEELGLFGAVCVIAMFMVLIVRFLLIATNASDLYGALIVVGVLAHITVQVMINISVVTNTIPPTGVPLPFISYGGTSLVMLLAEIGLVLSVARQMKIDVERVG